MTPRELNGYSESKTDYTRWPHRRLRHTSYCGRVVVLWHGYTISAAKCVSYTMCGAAIRTRARHLSCGWPTAIADSAPLSRWWTAPWVLCSGSPQCVAWPMQVSIRPRLVWGVASAAYRQEASRSRNSDVFGVGGVLPSAGEPPTTWAASAGRPAMEDHYGAYSATPPGRFWPPLYEV